MAKRKSSDTQQPASSVDLAIVGGGMVGLTLALLAAREMPELTVAVIEKSPLRELLAQAAHESFDARSTALSPGSASLLEALDVWPALEAEATPILSVHVSDRGHLGAARVDHRQFNKQFGGPALGYVVENARFGEALVKAVDACDAIKLCQCTSVDALLPRQTGAHVKIAEVSEGEVPPTRELEAKLVVIADGADSPLRQRLGISVRTHNYHQHAMIANVAFEKPHNGVAFERFTENGPLALLPLGGSVDSRRSALVWTHPDAELEAIMAADDAAFLQRLQQAFGHRLGRFLKVGSRVSYPLRLVTAEEQVRSSIVVMGNAAHSLHPVAGQGFNLALRDCAQLVSVLATAPENPGHLPLLQKYLQHQQQDQAVTTWISHTFNAVFGAQKNSFRLGRNAGLLALELSEHLRQNFFRQMMGRAQPRPKLPRLQMRASAATSSNMR